MSKWGALIAAAGRGTRAGLPYPKTLFPVKGQPILVRILTLLRNLDASPTVIVSPDGEQPVRETIALHHLNAHIVVQAQARGMGDAVLRFEQSPDFNRVEHLVLIWGDIPFIQPETLDAVMTRHLEAGNDLTFATRVVDSAYTIVTRDSSGSVTGLDETRERGIENSLAGERDIGLFVFRPSVVLPLLREELPGKWGQITGEHGFLYIVAALVASGFRVEALPVATELDLVSLNRISDIEAHL